MNLADLLAALPASPCGDGPVVLGARNRDITGLAVHSAQVRSGDLFAAIRGLSHDGHEYVADAVRQGAVAVLVDHPFPGLGATQVVVSDTRLALGQVAAAFHSAPSAHLWVCGVTGTNGKTTTTYLLEDILARAGHRVGLVGTLGARLLGAQMELHSSTPTTPEAPVLQRLLADMRAAGARDVIVEVTSHALVLHRVEGCRFSAAVFTNLTQDHLDFHQDFAGYRDAKARLFEMVVPDGVSVVNADDEAGAVMMRSSRAPVWTYGIERPADVTAERPEFGPHGTRLSIAWPGGRIPVELPLPGRFNVANALAAATVALARGIAPEVVREALETASGVPGRCEIVDEGQPFTVIVDYAHTPDGLEKVLELAREVAPGRCLAVFGCGGDRDRTKRPLMARIGTTLADYAVFTSDNPRSEDPVAILRDMEAGVPGSRNFESEPDRRRAIGRALALARPGDVVVIAGKGHEPYQILRDRTVAFDDREVAREWLRNGRRELGA
ncbi:MAG TPA: UDP-N-acetylmuramoyl-L-alanyl-D-glutamate--2,6-diaminopimelate ligase [bacterium]|nr:UDP-N-acetylmuramoyl-L-alanyl-D-glutamate--2,6-diaminopimelate ligase [bacterium]